LPTHLHKGFAIDQRVGNWAIVTRVSGVQGVIALKPNMPCWYLYAELRFVGMAELWQAAFYFNVQAWAKAVCKLGCMQPLVH